MDWRRRRNLFLSLLAVIAAGLAIRKIELGLPWVVTKYGGSILWGAMVYLLAGFIAHSRFRTALWAIAIAALVEFSKLFGYPPLDAFRQTTVGALLLGRQFSYLNLAAYIVGILAAFWIDSGHVFRSKTAVLSKANASAKRVASSS